MAKKFIWVRKKSVNPNVNNFRDFPKYLKKLDKKKNSKIFNIGNFNTNIVRLSKKILSLTKIKGVNVFHEINTIDKRSYEVSTKSSKKLIKNLNFNKFTNNSIIETFIKIKKDKLPFSDKKITLSIYKKYLKKHAKKCLEWVMNK